MDNNVVKITGTENHLSGSARKQTEFLVYYASAALVAALYLLCRFILPRLLPHIPTDIAETVRIILGFGVSQLKHLYFYWIVLWLVITIIAIILAQKRRLILCNFSNKITVCLQKKFLWRLSIALGLGIVFFILRNNTLNPDGYGLIEKIPSDVARLGAHVTHDEMMELYLHSRFWYVTNRLFGWSVITSYQALSAAAGGIFVLLLWNFCVIALPKNPLPYFILVIMGGYMQLFFGDVENYTLTATLIMAYYLCALLYVKGVVSLLLPSIALTTAMSFHLLAGFLLPSLLYLCYLEIKRRKFASVLLSMILIVGILSGVLILLDISRVLPLGKIFSSHALGSGGNYIEKIVIPSWEYFWGQINLLALLFPFYFLLLIPIIHRRVALNRFNSFMMISTIFMMLLFFLWRAQIGIYNDWNLFANCAMTLSLWVWYNVLNTPNIEQKPALLISFGAISFIHSISWILSNHQT